MGYKVRVLTSEGLRWLGCGQLKRAEGAGSYYTSPSAARGAARSYLNNHAVNYVFEVLTAPGDAVYELVEQPKGRLTLTISFEALEGGAGYRVRSPEAKCECVVTDLPGAYASIAKGWAEIMEAEQ